MIRLTRSLIRWKLLLVLMGCIWLQAAAVQVDCHYTPDADQFIYNLHLSAGGRVLKSIQDATTSDSGINETIKSSWVNSNETSDLMDDPVTTVTKYFDGRLAAMALNFDTELYLCGMIHSGNGYNPPTAKTRSLNTRTGWPNILQDTEAHGIPVSFNICGHEAVFGDAGHNEIAEIDILQSWHVDPHWSIYTWYSDKPQNGGNYLTFGDLSGAPSSYGLVYGGDLTEQTLNATIPHEISYHTFGHESLSNITDTNMNDTFRFGVSYHKRIGSKIMSVAPPWNNNPSGDRYPIYVQNGIFVFNRSEGSRSEPYEAIDNLWIIPRSGAFTASTDMTSWIDSVIASGVVLADYSHPEDGFQSSNRSGFQTSLSYARSKAASGELWATTLSEIGRYWEARSDASITTQPVSGKTVVDVTLTGYDPPRFGIPYLTFKSSMPDSSNYAKITVDYPTAKTLNSNSSTVRVSAGEVTYTVYLNPIGTTHIEIEGVAVPFTGGVDINKPALSITSTPPTDPLSGVPITIQASAQSTDTLYTVNLIYQRNSEARDLRIMALNGTSWEATIGPFNIGDAIHYYVSATNNSGKREISQEQQFTVLAGIPPGAVPDNDNYPGIPLTLSKSGNDLILSWGEPGGSCYTLDYGIYRGALPWSGYNHAPMLCSTNGLPNITILSMADSYYYFVVAQSGGWDGSYGVDSSNNQRPALADKCLPQQISSCDD